MRRRNRLAVESTVKRKGDGCTCGRGRIWDELELVVKLCRHVAVETDQLGQERASVLEVEVRATNLSGDTMSLPLDVSEFWIDGRRALVEFSDRLDVRRIAPGETREGSIMFDIVPQGDFAFYWVPETGMFYQWELRMPCEVA